MIHIDPYWSLYDPYWSWLIQINEPVLIYINPSESDNSTEAKLGLSDGLIPTSARNGESATLEAAYAWKGSITISDTCRDLIVILRDFRVGF